MGVLTDFFTADSWEIRSLDLKDGPPKNWPRVEGKNTTSVELATLEAILTGGNPNAIVDAGGDPVVECSKDGPWVLQVRDELTRALSALTDDGVVKTAQSWAKTEEWNGAADADDLADYVRELRDLSQKAVSTRRHIYVWICL